MRTRVWIPAAALVTALVVLAAAARAQDGGGLDGGGSLDASVAQGTDAAGAFAGEGGLAGDAVDGGATGGPAVAAGSVEPPVRLAPARPVYPPDGDGRRVDVELLLTVDETGAVIGAEVLGHIPPDAPESFDEAARAAARAMQFRPARRDGRPILVRVRYHMAITPPLVGDAGAGPPEVDEEVGGGTEGMVHSHARPDAGAPATTATTATTTTTARPAPPGSPPEARGVRVRGGAARERTATEYVIPVGTLGQVPRTTGTDLLSLAPGAMLSGEGTEGHAQHVFLRGFTGDNGQDIAFTLDGIPLNEESNTHGQGYADLYFIIPELVARLDVTEGVADPRQGNFAVAGSINYHLALRQRGATLRGIVGTYGYRRLLALYGPANTSDATFVGIDLVHSDGFGPARNYDRGSVLAQHEFDLGGGSTARLFASMYATRFVSPGVVREDDYEAGRVGFFDVYREAGRQGGFSSRALVGGAVDWRRGRERAELRVFAQLRELTILENFTGFLIRRQLGDLIEQRYGGGTVGANGYYQRPVTVLGRTHTAEVGWFLRHDRYVLGQQRLDTTGAPTSLRDPSDIDAHVRATNIGAYLDAVVRVHERLTLRGGARLDAMAYDVDAGVFRGPGAPPERAHRTAMGVHAGPKATAEVGLGAGLTALASLGSGFRSPDALTLADGETAPFTSVFGQEIGVRYVLPPARGRAARLTASLAGYHTLVDSDLLFDPTAGRSVPIGSTRRLGAVLFVRTQPLPWIDVNASVTYTRATVDADALGRTVPAGSLLPYVPTWVARLDAAVDREVARVRALPLRLRGGLGASYYGARPLPLDERSVPVFLLDASAGARLGPVELGLSARNLLDVRWRDAQLNFASSYTPGATASQFPVRHFTAGAPFTLFATLGLQL